MLADRASDMHSAVISGLVFPLQERFKGHQTVRLRRQLEASQWWSTERLREAQLDRLRAFLAECARSVPYYGELFRRARFDPSGLSCLEDMAQIPFLQKSDIRACTDSLRHRQARHLARFNTGGSSGEPLIFFIGRERVSHDVAAKWRATRWWGVDIGDPEIVVWGSPIELGAQDRLRQWRDRLMRTELLPAFEMSEARLDGFIDRIRTRRPRMLFGYPSALSHIALHAERRGVAMDRLGIRVAFCTSERLYDHQRSAIGRVFGCPVANGYGSRDAGFIAHECPHGGMHITAEDIVVEIVGRDGRVLPDGEAGEIVVTHLATRDFPFVRYRTGDVAVRSGSRCACGRGLPLLADIQGRATDFVTAADGTVMHGLALIYTLRDIAGIDRFKIVQEDIGRTRVLIVPGPGYDAAAASARVAREFGARLGAQVKIDVEVVPEIPPEASGKHRYVVSHVKA